MSIKVGPNIASLTTQRHLERHSQKIESVFERLSSGQRINHASDDAAGLAVATNLNALTRQYSQAHRNINDGISALSIAQGGIESLTDIVIRIKELAEQSANGTFSRKQRQALDTEAQALVSEYHRIGQTVQFNGRTLLNGSFSDVQIQAGVTNREAIGLTIEDVLGITTNLADGTFDPQSLYNAGASSTEIVKADVNNDGRIDLLVRGTNYIQVFTGNSDGTFAGAISLGGQNITSIAVGDFDRDGNMDIYGTTLTGGQNSAIWYGNGNGTFDARVAFAHNLNGDSIAVDINKDGWTDIITHRDFGSFDKRFQIYLNNQAGGFTDMGSLGPETEFNPSNVEVADFNHDGNEDLIYMFSENAFSVPNRIAIRLGNGNGTFDYVRTYRAGTDPRSLTYTDLNGDNNLDVVVANENTNNVSVLFGNADGSFIAPINYATGTAPSSVVLTDMNGDSVMDILVAETGSNSISVLYGNSGGTFRAAVSMIGASAPSDFALADYNGDGVNDLAYLNGTTFQMEVALAGAVQGSSAFGVSLLTQSSARSALSTTDTILSQLATQLGKIGAQQSRLQIASQNATTLRINYSASYSRIMDADIAQESAELVKTQILQQFASEVLGHTNQDAALVLQLLR